MLDRNEFSDAGLCRKHERRHAVLAAVEQIRSLNDEDLRRVDMARGRRVHESGLAVLVRSL